MGLRVLITNIELWPPSGTVLYVRDLALELQRQGHLAAVFSSTAGAVAEELRAAGIPLTARPGRLPWIPDIIHGHHRAPTLVALHHWPTVPAIHLCHDHLSEDDATPLDPQIVRHFGVSRLCVDRLLREGAHPDRTELLFNFVDTARFPARGPLPPRPRRALVFSNYAHAGSQLPAVSEACRQADLELDVVGLGVGNLTMRPEELLGQYDIVFAKAKAAIEAMAVGAAVVLCDVGGVGPMVTSAQLDELRALNFGFASLREPLRPEPLLRQIARYDPVDAALVRHRIRTEASLAATVDRLLGIYREASAEHGREDLRPRVRPRRGIVRESLFIRLMWRWRSLSPELLGRINRLPGAKQVRRGVRRLLGQGG
jgi:hypothetical protein